jgi:hypothetical protein
MYTFGGKLAASGSDRERQYGGREDDGYKSGDVN